MPRGLFRALHGVDQPEPSLALVLESGATMQSVDRARRRVYARGNEGRATETWDDLIMRDTTGEFFRESKRHFPLGAIILLEVSRRSPR